MARGIERLSHVCSTIEFSVACVYISCKYLKVVVSKVRVSVGLLRIGGGTCEVVYIQRSTFCMGLSKKKTTCSLIFIFEHMPQSIN